MVIVGGKECLMRTVSTQERLVIMSVMVANHVLISHSVVKDERRRGISAGSARHWLVTFLHLSQCGWSCVERNVEQSQNFIILSFFAWPVIESSRLSPITDCQADRGRSTAWSPSFQRPKETQQTRSKIRKTVKSDWAGARTESSVIWETWTL